MSRKRMQVARLLQQLGFPSSDAALCEITLLTAASQLAQFHEECARYEQKYGMPFEEFARRVQQQREREAFEAEDDLMAWRFARDGDLYWAPRVEELRRAV